MKETFFYLVCQHVGAGNWPIGLWYEGGGPTPERTHGVQDRMRTVGCHGHDQWCHCLIVGKQLYLTRDAAEVAAAEMQRKEPRDFFFTLEVCPPKVEKDEPSAP